MLKVRQKGDFSKVTKYFEGLKEATRFKILDKYGRDGVAALASATPVESGLTANSWYHTVEVKNGRAVLSFHNSNIQNGVPIAVILQYGHGTRNGGWVEGKDYINPALRPIFDRIVEHAWREVTSL